MTKERLKQCYYLHLELKKLDEKIMRLEAKCEGGAVIISDMPRGGVPPDFMTELADIVRYRERLRSDILCEIAAVEQFIADIPDSRTRLIFRLRYVDGMKWDEVADKTAYNISHVRRLHDKIPKNII